MADEKDILKPESQSEMADLNDSLKYLREDLSDGLEKLIKGESEKKFFDPELSVAIKEVFSKAIEKLGNITQPAPVVNIDMKPIEKMAIVISNQNKNILELIGKIEKEDNELKYQELFRSILSIINASNEFFSREIKHFDYTESLDKLIESNQRPLIQHILVESNPNGIIKKVIPVYKQ